MACFKDPDPGSEENPPLAAYHTPGGVLLFMLALLLAVLSLPAPAPDIIITCLLRDSAGT